MGDTLDSGETNRPIGTLMSKNILRETSMTQHKAVVYTTPIVLLLILFFSGIGASLAGFFLLKDSFSGMYISLVPLVLSLFFSGFGLFFLVLIFWTEKWVVVHRELIIYYQITGKVKETIPLSEIESYMVIEPPNKKWEELTFFTQNGKYTIYSHYNTASYELIKRKLVAGQKRNIYKEKLRRYKSERRFGIGFLIIGSLFLWFMSSVMYEDGTPILSTQLSTVSGTLAEEVEVNFSRKKKSKHEYISSIHLRLKEHPEVTFQVSGKGLEVFALSDLKDKVNVGAAIEIDILQEPFNKKIAKKQPSGFWDSTHFSTFIEVYGIRAATKSYFDLNRFNQEKETNKTTLIDWFLILGFPFFIICVGIYTLIGNKKPAFSAPVYSSKRRGKHQKRKKK
ncbi:MAG: hypothetical protein ACPGXL_08570 [Chitinophagales bacterium]